MPPGRVVESAPARLPLARHVARSAPRTYSCRNPASKLSPAPTVSTGNDFLRRTGEALAAALRERSFGAELHYDQRHQLRKFVDRRFQIFGAGRFAGFAFVRQKYVDVPQNFVQSAFPAVVGIIVGVERNREALRLSDIEIVRRLAGAEPRCK